jgi:mRNA-degrading endonuclease toxin of MazEF toxin-antitoxin module
LKAWDIFTYQPPGWPDPHPCVIVSHPDRVANKPEVSVLMCSSQRAQRQPKANEVILDTSDGLNWATLCKCDLIHTVFKATLKNQRGHVTPARRRQIIDTIIRCNDWL